MCEFTDEQFFEFYEANAIWMPDNAVAIHDVITTWMDFLKEQHDNHNTLPMDSIGSDHEEQW